MNARSERQQNALLERSIGWMSDKDGFVEGASSTSYGARLAGRCFDEAKGGRDAVELGRAVRRQWLARSHWRPIATFNDNLRCKCF